MYFSIPDLLREKDMSQRISVGEALLKLSKIYVIADGARKLVSEIPDIA